MKPMVGTLVFICMFYLFCREIPAGETGHYRIGGGFHYWRTLDDIEANDVDRSGLAYMASFQYTPGAILIIGLDLEIFPKEMTGTDNMLYAPQLFLLVGGTIYAGLGAGYYYFDGETSDDPFFVARAGLNMEFLPGIFADINLNYHFSELNELRDVDDNLSSDTLTLGACLRFSL